ncbi:hypothetical protein OO015_00450 [Thermomicrobium sp. 4228-Ro]|uniref:hypothetical protein n=1 Tax=Thermomicrobium sp. 4228-Ro TaxID=2993937 RepID=UPI002248D3B3|nr:hypothetical protein [Thermomicrobium sp. 4228-Ro]MCX2725977.1 hypothetical protein [Thermomicrobium sp. 4228-Ro]
MDLRDRIYHLQRNDTVVAQGLEPLRRHLDAIEALFQELAPALREEYGPSAQVWLASLRISLQAEATAARLLADATSAVDTPATRIALEAIRRCSEAIRILSYRRFECLWEVLALREGTRDRADLAQQLLDELHRCAAIH